jgi:NAD(P)-dependent dehydrogenase (short-subunit alcohol dehydrogenase family)
MPSLRGQVVLITGAASGLGAATAKELHARGAVPVLVDIDASGLKATANSIAPGLLTCLADVTDREACHAAAAATLARHGRIDIVWANAGIAAFGPLLHTDPGAWQRCVNVNVMGVFNTVRAALPAVVRSRGYVLVTASAASFAHPPAMSAYAASKAAVEAMCNAWRIELAAHGVGVGAVHASWVTTPLVTEGALHPGFVRLRATMPGPMNKELPVDVAARLIADGMCRRQRQIWVPGWVRLLHWLRALLHTAPAERELLKAAPEIEAHYLAGLAVEGSLASSFGPRERERALARGESAQTPAGTPQDLSSVTWPGQTRGF